MLMHANEARLRFGHTHHGPEHLLLGILQLNSKQVGAAQLIERLHIEHQEVLTKLERLLALGNYDIPNLMHHKGAFTEQAEEAIDYAYEEAYQMGDTGIGAKHVLIGLLRLHDSPAVHLLQQAGLNAQKIRDEK